jgi:hypothetical protein
VPMSKPHLEFCSAAGTAECERLEMPIQNENLIYAKYIQVSDSTTVCNTIQLYVKQYKCM